MPPRAKPERAVVRAEDLPPEYRARMVKTVSDLTRTVEVAAERLRLRAELALTMGDGHVPGIDHNMARGLLDLARTATELIQSYPGLLELHRGDDVGGDGAVGGADAAERLRLALGGVGLSNPG